MVTLITIIHVFVCCVLMLVILLQAGKGGGMGVAFGSSTSSAVFGGRGAGSFLEKLTVGSAVAFMLTSVCLAWFASQSDSTRLQKIAATQAQKHKADQDKATLEKIKEQAAERAKTMVPPAAATTTPNAATPAAASAPAKGAAAEGAAPAATKPAAAKEPKSPAQPAKAAPKTAPEPAAPAPAQ